MVDVVDRLRDHRHMTQGDSLGALLDTAAEAANEIDRLRAEVATAYARGIEDAAKRAEYLYRKHGSSVGDEYSNGVWDQGVRTVSAIRALSAEPAPSPQLPDGAQVVSYIAPGDQLWKLVLIPEPPQGDAHE